MNKLTTLILIGFAIAVTAGIAFAAATDRFHGGSYDGYRLSTITNTTVGDAVPSGTVIIIR
jgi:hypothetical protein